MHTNAISAVPDQSDCLDTVGLSRLEDAFRKWAQNSPGKRIRTSRQRILMIFLLIRYTGAKLNEVLALNLHKDIDYSAHSVVYGAGDCRRTVELSAALISELHRMLSDKAFQAVVGERLLVDPGFVRRKFYERAQQCEFPKKTGGPEMIRKARAVEMMQNNMPMPVVQMILGHSTPGLTSAYVSFSPEEIRQVTRKFMEKESSRATSARNSFFGKLREIDQGGIQTRVSLVTIGGHLVTTIITNTSLQRMDLKKGGLITAEVKAPWVTLHPDGPEPASSAENRLYGRVLRISAGRVNTEVAVGLSDGTEVCAVISTQSRDRLKIDAGDRVWTLFNGYAVVLHAD